MNPREMQRLAFAALIWLGLTAAGCYTQIGVVHEDRYESPGEEEEMYAEDDSTLQDDYDTARQRFYDDYYPYRYPGVTIGFGWGYPGWYDPYGYDPWYDYPGAYRYGSGWGWWTPPPASYWRPLVAVRPGTVVTPYASGSRGTTRNFGSRRTGGERVTGGSTGTSYGGYGTLPSAARAKSSGSSGAGTQAPRTRGSVSTGRRGAEGERGAVRSGGGQGSGREGNGRESGSSNRGGSRRSESVPSYTPPSYTPPSYGNPPPSGSGSRGGGGGSQAPSGSPSSGGNAPSNTGSRGGDKR